MQDKGIEISLDAIPPREQRDPPDAKALGAKSDAPRDAEKVPDIRRRLDGRDFYLREAEALKESRPERAALMLLESAQIAEEEDGGARQARRDVEEALSLQPNAGWVLDRARRMMLRQGLYEAALEVIEREVQTGGTTSFRVALLYEASGLVLYHNRDPEQALALSQQALRLEPHHMATLVRVAALSSDLERYSESAATTQQLAEYLSDPQDRARLLYRAAAVLEGRLDQEQAAESALSRAIESDPHYVPALAALLGLRERSGQWSALGRTMDHLAGVLHDADTQGRLRRNAGLLHFDRTENLEAACRQLAWAADAAPEDADSIERLAFAYEAKGNNSEAIVALRRLLALTPTKQIRAALLTQIASLFQASRDEDGAISAYREALEEVPAYLPAVQSLAMIYRQRGEHSRLVDIANPDVEGLMPGAARAVRYVELAELYLNELGSASRAKVAYRRALELAPDLHLAFWGLEQLLASVGEFEELAELLRTQAKIASDTGTRTYLLLRTAFIEAELLEQPEQALETLANTAGDAPQRLVELTRIDALNRAENFAEVASAAIAQAEKTSDRVEAEARRIQAARLYEGVLGEPGRALEIYHTVLQENPASMAAFHGAGRILYQRGAWAEVIKLHHCELVQEPQRADSVFLLCKMGRLLADKLGKFEPAIEAYSRALVKDPLCIPALVAVERLARRADRFEQLVDVLEKYGDAHDDNGFAAAALCRAGEIAGWKLDALGRAALLFERALARQPSCLRATAALERIYQRQGRWSDVATQSETLLAQTTSREERAFRLLGLAQLREYRLNEVPDFDRYQEAATAFGDATLTLELTRVRRELGRDDLAPWLIESARGGAPYSVRDDQLCAAHLVEAAQIYEFSAEEPAREFERAARLGLDRSPDDYVAIFSLERALLRSRNWAQLGTLYEKEAGLEADRSLKAQHLVRAGFAYYRAGDDENAARACRDGIVFDGHALAALHLLASLADQQGEWREAAQGYDRLAEACHDVDNRRMYSLKAARIWDAEVNDSARAVTSLSVALSDDPGAEQAFSYMVRLLAAQNKRDQLSAVYQRAIRANLASNQALSVERLRSHARLLRTWAADSDQIAKRQQHADRAIAEWRSLLAIAPDDVEALSELAALQLERAHWSDGAATLGVLAERANDDDTRHWARVEQISVFVEHLHDPERARSALEAAAGERPEDLSTMRLALRVAHCLGDWHGAQRVIKRFAESDNPEKRTWAFLSLAQIARVGLHDEPNAEIYEREVVTLVCRHPGCLKTVRAHESQPEAGERLVQAAEYLREAAVSAEEQIRYAEALTRLSLDSAANPDRALAHLKELLDVRPDDPGLRILLARALEKKGEPVSATTHYRAALDRDAGYIEAYRGLVRVAKDTSAAAAICALRLLDELDQGEIERWNGLNDGVWSFSTFCAEPPNPEEHSLSLQEILESLIPYWSELYPWSHGETIDPSSPLAKEVASIAGALGIPNVSVVVSDIEGARCHPGTPLILELSDILAREPAAAAFRFWVARAFARSFFGGAVLEASDTEEIDLILAALCGKKANFRREGAKLDRTEAMSAEQIQQMKKKLAGVLPRKVRRHLSRVAEDALERGAQQRFRSRLHSWADRLALAICREPGVALASLARCRNIGEKEIVADPNLSALLTYSVSEEYARLSANIWRARRERDSNPR